MNKDAMLSFAQAMRDLITAMHSCGMAMRLRRKEHRESERMNKDTMLSFAQAMRDLITAKRNYVAA